MATLEQRALFNQYISSDGPDSAGGTFSVDDHITMLNNAVRRIVLTTGAVAANLGMPLECIQALPRAYVQALRKTLTPPR
jgi:hypothetical protein